MIKNNKLYAIEITETLASVIQIPAENEQNALEKARQAYKNQQIVLGSKHHIDTEIVIKGSKVSSIT